MTGFGASGRGVCATAREASAAAKQAARAMDILRNAKVFSSQMAAICVDGWGGVKPLQLGVFAAVQKESVFRR
jgi:hypothetical protein